MTMYWVNWQFALFIGLVLMTFIFVKQFFGIEFIEYLFGKKDDTKKNPKDDFNDGPGGLA